MAWQGFGATLGRSAGTLAAFAYTGGLLGAYNGLFVDAPGADVEVVVVRSRRRRVVSLADGLVGAVLGAGAGLLAIHVLPNQSHIAPTTQHTLLFAAVAGLVGGLAAGFWRALNRERRPTMKEETEARPLLFSRRGCVLGGVTALRFPAVVYGVLLALGDTAAVLTQYTLPVVAIVVVAGVVISGLSRAIFWWVNTLPPRGMEVIRVLLILLVFVAQATQPVLTLLGIPMG